MDVDGINAGVQVAIQFIAEWWRRLAEVRKWLRGVMRLVVC